MKHDLLNVYSKTTQTVPRLGQERMQMCKACKAHCVNQA